MPLSERVVIVTGGGAGIGLGIVEAAGALGAHIVVAEKNVALAESVAALGRNTDFIETDVSDPDSITRLFASVDDRYGRLDGLVDWNGIPSGMVVAVMDYRAYRAAECG